MKNFVDVLRRCMTLLFFVIGASSYATIKSVHDADDFLVRDSCDNVKGNIERCVRSEGIASHDIGNLELVIDDVGGEEGWRFTHVWPIFVGPDHLYWNWLAIGYSSTNVSDGWDGDWSTTPGGNIVITEPGAVADEEGYAQFNDSTTQNGIQVTQYSYAWADPPHDDYVIVKYVVRNVGSSPIYTLYIGHRSDFDVLGDHGSSQTDMSAFDTTRHLGYMRDITSSWHVGVKLIQGAFRGYHIGWYISDDAEKYYALSTAGIDASTVYPDDYCFWLSTGPYFVTTGDSTIVVFAFLAGEDLVDLQANADSAQTKYESMAIFGGSVGVVSSAKLGLNIAPNPFTSSIEIDLETVGETGELCVYNTAGCVIKTFANIKTNCGSIASLSWDGTDDCGRNLPNGIYFLKLTVGAHSVTEKLLLIR